MTVPINPHAPWRVSRKPGAFWSGVIWVSLFSVVIIALNLMYGFSLKGTLLLSVPCLAPLLWVIPVLLHQIEVWDDCITYQSYLSRNTIRVDQVKGVELGGIKSHWRDKAGPLNRLIIELKSGREVSINPAPFEPEQFARFVVHISERSGVPAKGWKR